MFMAKPITVKPLRTRSISASILNAMKKSRDDVRLDLETTVATWNHHVRFTVNIGYKGPDARILAWTDDYVWNTLNRGTSRKFSRADPKTGYVSKSRVRVIGSFAGAGKMLPSRTPTKGITAREWTEVIFDENIKVFNDRINAAIQRGLLRGL